VTDDCRVTCDSPWSPCIEHASGRVPTCVECGAPIRVEVDLHVCDRCGSGRVPSEHDHTPGAACARCAELTAHHLADAKDWVAGRSPSPPTGVERVTRALFESDMQGGPYEWDWRDSTGECRGRLAWCEQAAEIAVKTLTAPARTPS